MPERVLSCPYCNSTFSTSSLASRVQCPRCDEIFDAAHQSEPATFTEPGRSPSPSNAIPEEERPVHALSNARLGLFVLGFMVLMGLVGGAYAWRTVLVRRAFDFHLPKTQALSVPIIARVALGIYVTAMVVAAIVGWNRRERRRRESGEPEPLLSRFGIPLLALAVIIGVGLAIAAIQTRPVRNPKPIGGDPSAVEAVAPAQLAALGYLPGDVNLVFGVHIAECSQVSAGRQFLKRFHVQGENFGFETIEQWTGLKLNEMEHAVMGVSFNNLIPRVTLVVRTIEPYDRDGVINDLKARGTHSEGLDYFRFELPKTGRDAFLIQPDERTLVIGWPEDGIKSLPSSPHENLDQFSLDLRGLINGPINEAARERPAQAWTACHIDNWRDSPAQVLVLLGLLSPQQWETLTQIKTFGVWTQMNDAAKLTMAFHAADAGSAARFLETLQKQSAKLPFVKVEGVAGPIIKELGANAKWEQDHDWVRLRSEVSAETIDKALEGKR